MALTLKDLITLTTEPYYLQTLCAKDHLEHVVTWVHMMEDTEIVRLFWGNELVVTTGHMLKTEDDLIHLIEILNKSRCSGLVINTGKYIKKIPQSVISYCEKLHFPLLTIPWKVYVTEFVKDCCSLINQSSRDEEELSETILNLIRFPQNIDGTREYLDQHFQEEKGFQFIAVKPERTRPLGSITDQRRILRLHSTLRNYKFPYSLLQYENSFLVLINQNEPDVAKAIARQIIRSIRAFYASLPVHIGISDIVDSYNHLPDCFHSAISASRRAALQKTSIVNFKDMGFYKLLYSVPDEALLEKYYYEVMDPLIEADPDGKNSYVETLFRYILCDGHLQRVAAKMFVHRNTINYRMTKIREILNKDFSKQSDRMPFLMAYHVGLILKIVEDLE